MSVEELRGICLFVAIVFWIRAFVSLISVRPLVNSLDPDDQIQYYRGTCQSYWHFLRGNILILPFDLLDLKQGRSSLWLPAFLILISAALILAWRSDRRKGMRLLAETESIPNDPDATY